jgi:hypothetical protein
MKSPLFHDAPPHAPGELYINHRDGTIRRPSHAPIPLEGPTTGAAYEELKRKEAQNNKAMAHIRRQLRSRFQCTQCKRKFMGGNARVKWRKVDGVLAETLVCFDAKCDAPIIMIEDGLDVRVIPGGRK